MDSNKQLRSFRANIYLATDNLSFLFSNITSSDGIYIIYKIYLIFFTLLYILVTLVVVIVTQRMVDNIFKGTLRDHHDKGRDQRDSTTIIVFLFQYC